ncbi:hypothetical protein DPMN_179276 [Dreissena polymorpha]|uniref:Uncharacterized protein n=1 Tax=Dreissena polymorpha TaxID=45954 RepID=A0A9D4IND0_DREPO|nr:hypothetical protein DPMN_179276 [Dreissena polymorpha]
MLDNLVRLRFTTDPNPGENRSNQINTLPITFLGLPIDSAITEKWHSSVCDGTPSCPCKKEENLNASDFKRVLLEPQNREQKLYTDFFRLMTWSNTRPWNKLTDEILVHIEGAIDVSTNEETIQTDENDVDSSPEEEREEGSEQVRALRGHNINPSNNSTAHHPRVFRA